MIGKIFEERAFAKAFKKAEAGMFFAKIDPIKYD